MQRVSDWPCAQNDCDAKACCRLVVQFDTPGEGGFILEARPCLEHVDEAFAQVGETMRAIIAGEGEAAKHATKLEEQMRDQHLRRFGV